MDRDDNTLKKWYVMCVNLFSHFMSVLDVLSDISSTINRDMDMDSVHVCLPQAYSL